MIVERTILPGLTVLLVCLGGCTSPLAGVSRKPLMTSSSSSREVDLRVVENPTPTSRSIGATPVAMTTRGAEVDREAIRLQLVDDFDAAPAPAPGDFELPAKSAADVNQMGHSLDHFLVDLDTLVEQSVRMQQSLLRLRVRPARPVEPSGEPVLAENEGSKPKTDGRKPKAES